jgi:alcohol dehydrogenase, propanol-preferring
MKAWVIDKISNLLVERNPLKLVNLPLPIPKDGEILIRVSTCGVCHTELDEIEGRSPPSLYSMIPGHQVVGIVEKTDENVTEIRPGDRVGVAWIYSACGECEYCRSGRENLCHEFLATGRDAHGGYAEYMVVPSKYAYKIPNLFTDVEAAPLLCAGAIGYRSLSLCNMSNGKQIGLTGFGASAHLVLKLIKYRFPISEVYVFARSQEERDFALELGCNWVGDITDKPQVLLDCVIDTTPVWKPLIYALENLKPGGRLVINAIRKENVDLENMLTIDYARHLWMEKEIVSVANVTRQDVKEFMQIAAAMPFKSEVQQYPFEKANQAILDIKHRIIKGAKVLVIGKGSDL